MENENTNTNTNVEQQETPKTYTADEVQLMLQKEGDRRVSSAEQKYKRTIEALKKQVENEKTLSQLDEESRAAAEKDMRIAELEEQLKDFQAARTKTEVQSVLAKRQLDVELADHIKLEDDVEASIQHIDALDKIIKRIVAREVKARLPEYQNIPQIADAASGKMTREKYNSLSLAEQQAMYNADPELVRNLIG